MRRLYQAGKVTIPQIHRLECISNNSTLFSSFLHPRMPRQQINLEPYRDEIVTLYHRGDSSDSISRTLESRHNIQVKERTIQSRLRKWGIRKRHRTTTGDEALHARIKMLYLEDRLTDKAMLNMLQQEGYGISERTLRRLRFKLGLHARTLDQEQHQVQEQMQMMVSLPQIGTQQV
jgi:hypothetical protein